MRGGFGWQTKTGLDTLIPVYTEDGVEFETDTKTYVTTFTYDYAIEDSEDEEDINVEINNLKEAYKLFLTNSFVTNETIYNKTELKQISVDVILGTLPQEIKIKLHASTFIRVTLRIGLNENITNNKVLRDFENKLLQTMLEIKRQLPNALN